MDSQSSWFGEQLELFVEVPVWCHDGRWRLKLEPSAEALGEYAWRGIDYDWDDCLAAEIVHGR